MPKRRPRYLRAFGTIRRAVPLLPILLASCGGAGSSEPMVNCARGGASRANSFADISLPSISSFSESRFDSSLSGFNGPPMAVAGDRFAIVAADRRLVLCRYDMPEWIYRFDEGEYPLPELACDSAGTIYTGTVNGMLCAVNDSGRLVWKKSLGDVAPGSFDLPTWPLVVPGGVVAGTTDGTVRKFDFAGTEVWSLGRGADLVRSVAFDPDAGIAIGITHNDYSRSDTIVLLDENGREKWAAPLQHLRIEYGPILVKGRVVVGVAERDMNGKYTPFVLTLDGSGREAWRAPLSALPLGIASDDDGNVYVSGGGGGRLTGGMVASYDPRGTLRWEIAFSESVPSVPVTSSDRVCFIAVRERTLGLYTYMPDGRFVSFTSIDALAEIVPVPVIMPYGGLAIAGADEPVLLRSR